MTKQLAWGGIANNAFLSELNLITCRDGQRRRWLLLGVNAAGILVPVIRPFARQTDIPIVRVQDEIFGWKIIETPYKDPG